MKEESHNAQLQQKRAGKVAFFQNRIANGPKSHRIRYAIKNLIINFGLRNWQSVLSMCYSKPGCQHWDQEFIVRHTQLPLLLFPPVWYYIELCILFYIKYWKKRFYLPVWPRKSPTITHTLSRRLFNIQFDVPIYFESIPSATPVCIVESIPRTANDTWLHAAPE